MTSPASLEQQLQQYRQKLAMYKGDGVNNVSTRSIGGGGAALAATANGNSNNSNGVKPQPSYQDRSKDISETAPRSNSSLPQVQQLNNRPAAAARSYLSAIAGQEQMDQSSSKAGGSSFNEDVSPEKVAAAAAPAADVLFNYDDDFDRDNLSGSDTEEDTLTWRADPSKSLSDWTILVLNRETRETQPYHVHRNVLAVGPRKSEYFVRFFLSHDRLSKTTTSTEIWLDSVAADAMPQLLDYMYSTDGTLHITTECAVGLRHLAQYFGMRALHKKVMAFITADLTMSNLKTYYQHTVAVDDTKVSELASSHCARHVMEITIDDPLLQVIDPSFLRKILMADEIDTREKQLHISQLLAAYCKQQRKVLDDQDFMRLTDEKCLPLVHYSAALTFMELECDLVLLDHQKEEDVLEEFTSLQNRCLADLTEHWEELCQMPSMELTRICRKLPSAVVTEIMVRSLGHAKKRLIVEGGARDGGSLGKQQTAPTTTAPNGSSHSSSKAASIMESEYAAKIAELKREHQEALDRIKGEFESNLMKMREAVIQKDKFISQYWNELKRFERVPNTPEGKMVQSTSSALKVLKMPAIGNQPAEGLILSKPKAEGGGGGGGKFPIFVYNSKRQEERMSNHSDESSAQGSG